MSGSVIHTKIVARRTSASATTVMRCDAARAPSAPPLSKASREPENCGATSAHGQTGSARIGGNVSSAIHAASAVRAIHGRWFGRNNGERRAPATVRGRPGRAATPVPIEVYEAQVKGLHVDVVEQAHRTAGAPFANGNGMSLIVWPAAHGEVPASFMVAVLVPSLTDNSST